MACVSHPKQLMYQMPSRASSTGAFFSRGVVRKCWSCKETRVEGAEQLPRGREPHQPTVPLAGACRRTRASALTIQ